VVVPAFALLCWWQVRRATSGNELSWAYVFEWPLFALYAVYMWWRLVHEPVSERSVAAGDETAPAAAAAEDAELAAYNRYLADLHASGRPKRW
jgi:hypothetical protein